MQHSYHQTQLFTSIRVVSISGKKYKQNKQKNHPSNQMHEAKARQKHVVKSLHCLCCPSCNLLFQTKCGYSCRKQGKAEQYWTQERRPWDGGLAFIDWEGGSLFLIAFCHRSSGLPGQELTNLIQAGRDWLTCGCSWKPRWARAQNEPQTPRSSSLGTSCLPLAVAILSCPLVSLGRIAPSDNELVSSGQELCLWCEVVAWTVLASNRKF